MTPKGYPRLEESDVQKLLISGAHCGEKSVNSNMKRFIFLRRSDGHYCIDIKKTWNHLLLAARILAGIENPKDVLAISTSPDSQRAVLKFASFIKCNSITENYTAGTLTNQSQKIFKEPRIIVVSDPTTDHQIITESARMNIPIIALCNTNCPLNYVDVVIPCNNKGGASVGLIWWMLAREILRFRGVLSQHQPWKIMPDMFLPRDIIQEDKDVKPQSKAQTNAKIEDKPVDVMSDRFASPVEPMAQTFDFIGVDTVDAEIFTSA